MLLRLAYLAATNTIGFLRLLPMSDREKDIEIWALRHQLLILQRQVGKPRFEDTDRAVLASLLHHLPLVKLRQLRTASTPSATDHGATLRLVSELGLQGLVGAK
ncbi:hypothetical protein ACFY1B_22230 [Streptomyces mirabilis]|uniref:hypothetical protein n=1 Tax=Streptomyces mirabilis TaxID=68239 RepID=UPI0036B5DBD8